MVLQTFTDLLQGVYAGLGQIRYSLVTAAGSGTLTDSTLPASYQTDAFVEGFIVIQRDAGGGGAAPNGEFKRITAYNRTTKQFSHAAFTALAAAGDRYGYTRKRYRLQESIPSINIAIKNLGRLQLVNKTQITTEGSRREYPSTAVLQHGGRPTRIDIETNKDDSDDNRWEMIPRGFWEYEPAAAGAAGTILFRLQYPAGNEVKVWYEDYHPALEVFSDPVSETLNFEVAKWAGVVQILQDARILQIEEKERLFNAERSLADAKADWMLSLDAKPRRKPKKAGIHHYPGYKSNRRRITSGR